MEDRYRCAAGIPGPALEMRSGTLPRELAQRKAIIDVMPFLADVAGLELEKLREHSDKIAHEYGFMKVLCKCRAITCDLRSRLTLAEDYLKALIHRSRRLSVSSNPSGKTRQVRLRIRNQAVNISYPANLVSLGLLWEIYAEEVYDFENPVGRIYDLGANIGLSAIYFHLRNPSAELVCVEPMEENLQMLERNLHRNRVSATLIRAAVGTAKGKATLFFGDQSHALPSLYTKQLQTRQVTVLPLDRIVSGNGYGLKIDVEGAEGSLVYYPSIIENAAWIAGELHYSGNTKQDSLVDAFFDIVNSNFAVKKGRPIVYFVGNEVMLCETFKTLKKTSK
jgi:FkbM family methyltransferase